MVCNKVDKRITFLSTGGLEHTSSSTPCINCPYNVISKHYYYPAIGNVMSGNLIVLPYISDNALNIIYDTINDCNLLDNVCITALVKCPYNNKFPINENVIAHCIQYLITEFNADNFINIMLLGDASRYMMGIGNIKEYLSKVVVSRKKRNYFVNYNPLVKDDKQFELFKTHLVKWYSAIINKTYNYDIVRI